MGTATIDLLIGGRLLLDNGDWPSKEREWMTCHYSDKGRLGALWTHPLPKPKCRHRGNICMIVDTISDQSDLEADLKQFWELESIGITPAEETVHSRMVKEIIIRNGRYKVSLPKQPSCHGLSRNYGTCVKWL